MGVGFSKNGIVNISGTNISDNILLNSATLPGKNGSTIEDNITIGTHNGTSSWSEAYWPCSVSASGNPLNGKTVTISLDFKCTDVSKIGGMIFGFGTWNSSNTRVSDLNIYVSSYTVIDGIMSNNMWCRISNTFVVPTSWTGESYTYRLQIKTNSSAEGAVMYHKKIKVELNTSPTPWIISSTDIGFIPSNSLIELNNKASIGKDFILNKEIIEI